jgi:hypothetical protein
MIKRNTRGGPKKRKPIEYKGVGYTNGKKVKIENIQPKIQFEKHKDKNLDEIEYVFGPSQLPNPYFFPVKMEPVPMVFKDKTPSPLQPKDKIRPTTLPVFKQSPSSVSTDPLATQLSATHKQSTTPKVSAPQPSKTEPSTPQPVVLLKTVSKESPVLVSSNNLESKISKKKFNWSKIEDEQVPKIQPKGNPTRKFKWSNPTIITENESESRSDFVLGFGTTAKNAEEGLFRAVPIALGAKKAEEHVFGTGKTVFGRAFIEAGISASGFGPVTGAGAKISASGKASEDIRMEPSGIVVESHPKPATPFIFGSSAAKYSENPKQKSIEAESTQQPEKTNQQPAELQSRLEQPEHKHKELYHKPTHHAWSIPVNDLPESIISLSKTHTFPKCSRVFNWTSLNVKGIYSLIAQVDNDMN